MPLYHIGSLSGLIPLRLAVDQGKLKPKGRCLERSSSPTITWACRRIRVRDQTLLSNRFGVEQKTQIAFSNKKKRGKKFPLSLSRLFICQTGQSEQL